MTRYDKNGRVVRELTIHRSSDSHARIVEWTTSLKKRGFTLATWIPELLVASDRVIVRFSGKRVFLIVRDDRGNPGPQHQCLYGKESDEMRAYLLSLLESDGAAVER